MVNEKNQMAMNKYILDTNICIYWLNGNQVIEKRLSEIGLEKICITFVTEGELFYGAYKSAQKSRNLTLIKELKQSIKTINTAEGIPTLFGKIKTDLETKGQSLDDPDIYIACLAIHHQAILVTNNLRHFQRIPGLKLENWKQP